MKGVVYCPLDDIVLADDSTQDIWSLMAPSDNKLRLLGWELYSDATAAAAISLVLQHISAVGSGGAVATEVLADSGDDQTIVGSVRTEDTTPGTADGILQGFQWEQLGPLGMIYTPEMAPVIDVSHGIALVTSGSPGTPTLSGWVCWEIL